MNFQAVKGMDDCLSPAVEAWQALESKSRAFFEARGFREIRTPILEATELFSRAIGEASDIVHKEMYTFEDRGGRSLTMRPEMTASVARAALEHHLIKEREPLPLYYLGPMFRTERPQAGRKRQFHQIGAELLNDSSASSDAELVVTASHYLAWLGLKQFNVKINHLGTAEDRKEYAARLKNYFSDHAPNLCPDCRYRLERNVLRIFDCKLSSCEPFIKGAPRLELKGNARTDFESILSELQAAGVPHQVESRLVRGLDYYTGCVYEVTAKGLGSQDAVLAGGRYDDLIRDLGGPASGASGFSVGIERLLQALESECVFLGDSQLKDLVYVAGIIHGAESRGFYRAAAGELLKAGKRAHYSFSGASLSNHLKRANKMKAGFTLIVGEDEFSKGEVSLKEMAAGIQKKVSLGELGKSFGDFQSS